jgi:hypothetical protein
VRAFEGDFWFHASFSSEKLEQVLSDNRKYFFVNSVKFIETTEGTSSSKTLEVSLHKQMVHTIRAVEHYTVFSQGFSKILSGFSLSCSSRSSGGSTKIELQGSHQSHVALIGERSNNESTIVSKVLITVRETCYDTLNPSLVNLILIGLPIVTELHDPFESGGLVNLRLNQTSDNIKGVDIDDDKSINRDLSKLL